MSPVAKPRNVPSVMANASVTGSLRNLESLFRQAMPDSTRLSCPVCDGILLSLLGDGAVDALERHLERDHWYPPQLAHQAAGQALKKIQ